MPDMLQSLLRGSASDFSKLLLLEQFFLHSWGVRCL